MSTVNSDTNYLQQLGSYLGCLPSDSRRFVETDSEYQMSRDRMLDRFLTYLLTNSKVGEEFLQTSAGQKLSSQLLSSAVRNLN